MKQTRNKKQKIKTAKGRKLSSTLWLQRQLNDPYVHMAKKDGYKSRAAYKLIEINDKHKILKSGQLVIDLGAAPGGWSQVAAKIVAPHGKIIALDLKEFDPIKGVEMIIGDFTKIETLDLLNEKLKGKKADLILSDMAPAASGMPGVDHDRIIILCEQVIDFSHKHLKTGGAILVKVLQGGTEANLLLGVKKYFSKVKHIKPPSSRKSSAEMYMLAIGYKGINE